MAYGVQVPPFDLHPLKVSLKSSQIRRVRRDKNEATVVVMFPVWSNELIVLRTAPLSPHYFVEGFYAGPASSWNTRQESDLRSRKGKATFFDRYTTKFSISMLGILKETSGSFANLVDLGSILISLYRDGSINQFSILISPYLR